ncbi:Dus3p [Sugiyamaella lignohabitans]|uniref:tRNA-dihydrouridine(47) synthase [NAD(P)(+)] n=1 Tax=Sugiyamaella lignohabitans TaxID=796027 RepID=A0A167D7J2_9ASCO|nr:Dus3p [Sugiyamaella lignohabitans]ANB12579.1 Dus3p [Sugiyamaella lignohabitans]
MSHDTAEGSLEPDSKRIKLDTAEEIGSQDSDSNRIKGIAPIKAEYILEKQVAQNEVEHDDEAEGQGLTERGNGGENGVKNKKKNRGQNKKRNLVQANETIKLCEQIKGGAAECKFGESCKYEHDVAKYIASKPTDIPGVCPVFAAIGYCPIGLRCRWLTSHFSNNKLDVNEELKSKALLENYEVNRIDIKDQMLLNRKKFDFPKSEGVIKYLDDRIVRNEKGQASENTENADNSDITEKKDLAASFIESPLLATEKKKLYLKGAKILSPLTTVGNLPYRRLMKKLGADVTYSEMALALPLLQGQKSEWALPRAHSSEVGGFGVQIATSKHWQAIKAAEAIAKFAPHTSEINLNCGCPIDLLYKQGAGSALLDNQGRLMRMVVGMNAVSGDIPVTVKLRTGTRDGHPTARNIVSRLLENGQVASITLHGRSRAQRYTRLADWDYIKDIADFVKEKREGKLLEGEEGDGRIVKPWIIGNGDIFSWKDWYDAIEKFSVDSSMVARGALIKPWIFEEVDARQYLDKSATERLEIVKTYANYGLEHWGSDTYGVNQTRRFLCEFLSFTHRYIPVGILEYLPPRINDRPPLWKGRNELETLLASTDYKDWIKISEMFLGPANEGFEFAPKHKSNAYES